MAKLGGLRISAGFSELLLAIVRDASVATLAHSPGSPLFGGIFFSTEAQAASLGASSPKRRCGWATPIGFDLEFCPRSWAEPTPSEQSSKPELPAR
jgi:hypothetical protein